MIPVVLASASPRRKELLEQIGVSFTIFPAQGEELITKETPWEVVTELSRQKAMEVADRTEAPAVVIGADTVVALDHRILGKPADEEEACRMIGMLQGNTHTVYTGVTVIAKGENPMEFSFYEQTKVTMFPMSDEEIQAYVATKEPMDKAGAYGIQGVFAVFIKQLEGDYNNVVGLPVARLYQECRKRGIFLCPIWPEKKIV